MPFRTCPAGLVKAVAPAGTPPRLLIDIATSSPKVGTKR
jgi:hypothetical protein